MNELLKQKGFIVSDIHNEKKLSTITLRASSKNPLVDNTPKSKDDSTSRQSQQQQNSDEAVNVAEQHNQSNEGKSLVVVDKGKSNTLTNPNKINDLVKEGCYFDALVQLKNNTPFGPHGAAITSMQLHTEQKYASIKIINIEKSLNYKLILYPNGKYSITAEPYDDVKH